MNTPWSDKQCRTFHNVYSLGFRWLGGLLVFAPLIVMALRIDVAISLMLWLMSCGMIAFVHGLVVSGLAESQLQINELKRRIAELEAARSSEKPTPS
jgi:hypothetical protein